MTPIETNLPENEEILRQLKAEGQEALARFFSDVRSRLARIISFRLDYRLSGRISESDVIQDTFVRAAQRLDGYLAKPDMPFFVWLRLEAQQKLLEVHRQHFGAEKRDVRREINLSQRPSGNPTSLALAARLVAQLTSASQIMERAEQINRLERTLNEMNELDREIIALRHFEELSNLETAEILRIEPAAASKRYIRALKRLREIMESLQRDESRA